MVPCISPFPGAAGEIGFSILVHYKASAILFAPMLARFMTALGEFAKSRKSIHATEARGVIGSRDTSYRLLRIRTLDVDEPCYRLSPEWVKLSAVSIGTEREYAAYAKRDSIP